MLDVVFFFLFDESYETPLCVLTPEPPGPV